VDLDDFREALLQVMDRKSHWAWPQFTDGTVRKELLHLHFEQEWATYVRDFPIFLGRAYVQCPIADVRRELAANLYEEETGALSLRRPHAELFLLYPAGLGMDLARFSEVEYLPAARAYREALDATTTSAGWDVATAVATIFVEGTQHDRFEVERRGDPRPQPPLEEHPLVRHYGLAVEQLALTRAHRMVEGDHRQSAWRMVLQHVTPQRRAPVVAAMERALAEWLLYRDAVAAACGLTR
jgi:pyrroloquinoline-quinone synthase